MSILEKSIERVVEYPAFTLTPAITKRRHWYVALPSPLWLCLLMALGIRVWLTYHTHGVIDGDEAMVGIQAEHILRGELPIYFYGQPFMGSLEAYLMAMLFAIAGPSVWMLRAEPMLLSLVVVWLTWKFAAALADAAQLSSFSRQLFQTLAALFAAISPLYDTVLELRALGGYIETFVLMLLLLLSAFQLTRRWHVGASNKELAWRWIGIGLIVGLGIWVDLLIASAVLAAAIWIIGFCVVELVQSPTAFLKGLLPSAAAIPACLIGMAPALYWGLRHKWANLTFALQLGSMESLNADLKLRYHDRLSLIRDMAYLFQQYVAPRVISGALPTEGALSASIHFFTLMVGLCCILTSVLLVALSLFWHHPRLIRMRRLVALPLLFAMCVTIAFCTSITSTSGLNSFQHDLAGRYATPLMLVLPFFFAATFTLASVHLYNFAKWHALKNGQQYKQKDGQKNSNMGGKTEKQGSLHRLQALRFDIPLVSRVLLFAVLLTYLGAQVSTYALTDPNLTFQSPSCPIAPANDDPMIAYLQHEHVHYAWAISWIGYPITFKTNNGIITSDPRTIFDHFNLGRVPAYTEALLHAQRPAMLTMVDQHDTYPPLLRILDSLHVTYLIKRFPSEPGYDVLVVTSMSRTVSILESKDFVHAFPGCV